MKKLFTLFLLILMMTLNAKAELLDFEGINDHTSVGDYYLASYDISFDLQAAAYTQSAATKAFDNPPSPETIIYSSSTFEMHKPSGFTDSLSFYYSNNTATTVTIFDAFGNPLAPPQTITPTGNPTPPAAPDSWQRIIIPFTGTATRVEFGGDTLYDNIYLGSVHVPTLSNIFKIFLLLLFAGISIIRLQQRHT